MIGVGPSYTAFLTEMQRRLEVLDFAGIEALALAPHGTNPVSRPH